MRRHKDRDQFHKHPRTRDLLQSRCKACALRIAKEHYHANREAKIAYQREWNTANPERRREYLRRHRIEKIYGLSQVEYAEIVRDGSCAICGEVKPKMCIDHDHATGEVRGWLCDPCNQGLGRFEDNVERLRAAARYLAGADF